MLAGIGPNEAEVAFRAMVDADVKAFHPRSPSTRPVGVTFDVARDADHVLYKGPEDTHGRAAPMSKLPEDFQADRAARVRWIAEVPARPDAIYASKREPARFAYLCRTVPGEEFLVLIEDRPGQRDKTFITAYVVEPAKWQRTRLEFVRTYPTKKGPAHKS